MAAYPLLEVHELRAGYGATPILQGVEFSVGKGEIVAIIGRNGVGKTTLMKCLIGLLPATAGTILYDRSDVTPEDASVRARRGIGYIPQGRGIFPRLTVAENLTMGEMIGSDKGGTKLRELVDRYFPILATRSSQRAGTMSGGEQQQLAIGRALIGNPDLVLSRRAVRGHSTVHRSADLGKLQEAQCRDRAHRAVRRAEHRHDHVDGATMLCDGQGRHRRSGRARGSGRRKDHEKVPGNLVCSGPISAEKQETSP